MIRRMLGAIVLLFVVSAVTFAIFFLVPRIGGATADDLASRYVGKSAGPAQIHEAAVRLGFTDPIWVQYGRFAKGIVAGSEYNTGASIESALRRASATPSSRRTPCCPTCSTGCR